MAETKIESLSKKQIREELDKYRGTKEWWIFYFLFVVGIIIFFTCFTIGFILLFLNHSIAIISFIVAVIGIVITGYAHIYKMKQMSDYFMLELEYATKMNK